MDKQLAALTADLAAWQPDLDELCDPVSHLDDEAAGTAADVPFFLTAGAEEDAAETRKSSSSNGDRRGALRPRGSSRPLSRPAPPPPPPPPTPRSGAHVRRPSSSARRACWRAHGARA